VGAATNERGKEKREKKEKKNERKKVKMKERKKERKSETHTLRRRFFHDRLLLLTLRIVINISRRECTFGQNFKVLVVEINSIISNERVAVVVVIISVIAQHGSLDSSARGVRREEEKSHRQ
jgi:hypothetical protein